MGKDISLIMTSGKSLIDVIRAGQQPDPVDAVSEAASVPNSEYYNDFPRYLEEIFNDNDFNLKNVSNFNNKAGFVASWILSSVKPAWYFRDCSISLFLEQVGMPQEKWSRYISDWASVNKETLPDIIIENGFTDSNYSLGCLISPENCRNFLDDYKSESNFKTAVDKHFGVFVAGLVDALYSAGEANTDLIESMDIFVVYMMNPNTKQWQFNDQNSYSTNTYDEMNIALQAFSIEAQVYGGNAKVQQNKGDNEKANAYLAARQQKIDMMVHNGNIYVNKVSTKTGLNLPTLTPEMWE